MEIKNVSEPKYIFKSDIGLSQILKDVKNKLISEIVEIVRIVLIEDFYQSHILTNNIIKAIEKKLEEKVK